MEEGFAHHQRQGGSAPLDEGFDQALEKGANNRFGEEISNIQLGIDMSQGNFFPQNPFLNKVYIYFNMLHFLVKHKVSCNRDYRDVVTQNLWSHHCELVSLSSLLVVA